MVIFEIQCLTNPPTMGLTQTNPHQGGGTPTAVTTVKVYVNGQLKIFSIVNSQLTISCDKLVKGQADFQR